MPSASVYERNSNIYQWLDQNAKGPPSVSYYMAIRMLFLSKRQTLPRPSDASSYQEVIARPSQYHTPLMKTLPDKQCILTPVSRWSPML
jgi:hypothetical protein